MNPLKSNLAVLKKFTSPTLKEQRQRRWLRLTAAMALLLLGLLLVLCLALPALVEWQVQRLLNGLTEKGSCQFSVQRIGLFSSNVRLLLPDPDNPEADPRLAVDSCQLFYHPLALLRKRIDAVQLTGVQGIVSRQNGKLILPAEQSFLRRPTSVSTESHPPLAVLQELPVSIGEISVSGIVLLRLEDERNVLPFRLRLRNLDFRPDAELQLTADAYLGGNFVRLQAALNPSTGHFSATADVNLQVATLPLAWRRRLPPLFQGRGSLSANGQWTEAVPLPERLQVEFSPVMQVGRDEWQVTGRPRLTLRRESDLLTLQLQDLSCFWRRDFWVLNQAKIEADLASGHLRGNLRSTWNGQFENNLSLTGSWQAATATTGTARLLALITGPSDGELRLQMASADGGFTLALNGNELTFKQPKLDLRWEQPGGAGVAAALQIAEITLRHNKALLQGSGLSAKVQVTAAALALQGRLERCHFAGENPAALQIQAEAISVQGGSVAPEAPLTLQGTIGTFHLAGKNWQLASSGASITATDVVGGMRLQVNGTPLSATIDKRAELVFPDFQLELEVLPDEDSSSPYYYGQLTLNDGRLQEQTAGITVEQINLSLPFFWPLNSSRPGEPGRLQLGRIIRGKTVLGHLELECAWQNDGLQGQGDLVLLGVRTDLNGGLSVNAAGDLRAEAALQLQRQSLPTDLPWAEWLPGWSDLQLTGEIEAELGFSWQSGESNGRLGLQVHQLDAVSVMRNVALRGGRLSLEFPRLPELATAGSQRLACRELQFDKLQFGSGFLLFRLDNPRLAYLESLRLKWCDGVIRTGSVKLSADSERLLITLYGDHLRLPALLAQFGFGSAEGDGRINGSLPMLLSRDNLRFRDGFLYSVPGKSGQIRLQPSALVSSTAAANEQMQLALEALKDFSYNWARLTLDTTAETLQLSLQVDGKPNQRLYFRPEGGGFVKSEVANDFQGLALNLNISVPLQEFLRYYGDWQKLSR